MLAELLETIEGCVRVLDGVAEESNDSRLWAVMSALRYCVEQLDEMDNAQDSDGE